MPLCPPLDVERVGIILYKGYTEGMATTLVLFTRDLRVHDHPALHAAAARGEVVPLFVLDPGALKSFGATNRISFLLDSLADLRRSLRTRGGDLWLRRGKTVDETLKLAREVEADAIFLSSDASSFAGARFRRLRSGAGVEVGDFPGISVVEAGALTPGGGDHYRVFTPYMRAWLGIRKRPVLDAPSNLRVPGSPEPGALPELSDLTAGERAPDLVSGGESAARSRAEEWLANGVRRYDAERNDMAADSTSRLSPYLHFGCISARELVAEAPGGKGGTAFVRQLVWRDFFLQVLEATPSYPVEDYRRSERVPTEDGDGLGRWKEGLTGIPLVDAGMRQLIDEGWMHNRARLVTATFLTRHMNVDWRAGAQHFWDLLVDGDVASNAGNWQWVAGTGNATRRNNPMNPLRQAKRFDRAGDYVRRYVPELADLDSAVIHEPWKLGESELRARSYPMPSAVDPDLQGALTLRS